MDGNTPALMQSEKERAPWNDNKVQERTFKMSVDCTFRKEDIEVTTDDYIPYDDEGVLCENTEFTDWKRAYEDNHYTIPELLEVLKGYLKHDLECNTASPQHSKQTLKRMLDDCDGWNTTDVWYNEA